MLFRSGIVVMSMIAYDISIHAPHTGRDFLRRILFRGISIFQSTRPIRGATRLRCLVGSTGDGFQSTRPIRGATFSKPVHSRDNNGHFNPRAPYGARPNNNKGYTKDKRISIHAPHTGRDFNHIIYLLNVSHFNPRAPYGARQQKCIIYVLHFCNNRQSKHKNQQETSSVRTFF